VAVKADGTFAPIQNVGDWVQDRKDLRISHLAHGCVLARPVGWPILRAVGALSMNEQQRLKYPRTPHLPWSLGRSSDDIVLADSTQFSGKKVVVTEKMDGENTTMTRQYIHARSVDSGYHASRTWVKRLHAQIKEEIPEGWRICGENLYAQHSIAYETLPDFFLVFSIWDERNAALSWDETENWSTLLGLRTVPVLQIGLWDESAIRGIVRMMNPERQEGYVVRLFAPFDFADFANSVAKFVRSRHVRTDTHWLSKPVVPNKLCL